MPDAPHADRSALRPSGRVRLLAQALVLALVVGGTSAFALLHKTVTLDVDGELRTVSVLGRTVDDVLAAHDVPVGPRDLVVPALGDVVRDAETVVVRHGREVTVVVDGEERTVWSTALTVGEVVAELGLRADARTSTSRSAGLGREALSVSTAKTVHVAVDGTTRAVTTRAATVREVLAEQDVVLGEHDRVSAPLDAAVVDGMVVLVTRVVTQTRTERTETPFETVRQEDPRLLEGRERVAVEGRPGVSVVTYVAHLVGDSEVGRDVLAASVVAEPVDEVVRVGTMTLPDPADAASVTPGTARAVGLEMTLARGWDEGEFACLDKLWTKESGWRVTAENRSSGAYGIPQALPGSKMASAGADWRTSAQTQIAWGLGYIANRYGTPCDAWAHSQARNWY